MNGIGCKELTYNELIENEEDKVDWNKRTVQFMLNNYDVVDKMAKVKCRSEGLNEYQKNDVLSDLLMTLLSSEDYDEEKAVAGDTTISIKDYISKKIGIQAARYRTDQNKYNAGRVWTKQSKSSTDDTELDYLDICTDASHKTELDMVEDSLDKMLKDIEGHRYKYGADIYMILYISYATKRDKTKRRYESLLEVLGIDKKELRAMERDIVNDFDMSNLLKQLSATNDDEKILGYIEPYVYGSKILKKTTEELA